MHPNSRMQSLICVCLTSLLLLRVEGFVNPVSHLRKSSCVMSMNRDESNYGRREFLATSFLTVGSLIVGGRPEAAQADTTLIAAKSLYFRYVPRINTGKEFYATELKKAIDEEDWSAVQATFVKEAIVQPTSKQVNPPKTSRWQRDLFDPMTIWSSTFAEKGTSKKTSALQEEEKNLEVALAKLERVAGGNLTPLGSDSGGFFGFGKKDVPNPNEGKSQKQIALEAWEEGKTAINDYVTIANKGLSRELRTLETI